MTSDSEDAWSTAAEDVDELCFADTEADLVLQGAPWHRYAVLGDSSAEGLGEPSPGYRTITWAERTRAALARQQTDLRFVNLGLRDLVAAEVREQQLDDALQFEPDLVAVVCGGNDAFRRSFDPERTGAELDAIVAALRAAGADVVTFCLMDISQAIGELAPLAPKFAALNDQVRTVSQRHGALLVDMWQHPACAERDVFSSDMVHASMRGHAILATETIKALASSLTG